MTADTAPTSTSSEAPPGRTGAWLLFVGLGALVVSLSQSILIPVLARLPVQLETSPDNVQWLLTSTLLVAAISIPVLGRMGDMFGKRRMLLIALGVLVLGSLITAVTSNIALLIFGRAIQGISMAAVPLGISLLSTLLPKERAGTGIAIVSAMLGVGGALGLPLAGYISDHADFHVLFWMMAGGSAIAFAGVLAFVPEARARSGGRIDALGTVLLAGALVSLLLPLAETSKWGWGSAKVIGLLALSVVLFAVFGWWQHRAKDPLVDLVALRRPPILLTNIASALFGFALYASLIGTSSYVQAPESSGYGFGSSMLVGGLALLPSGLCMLFFAPISAKLVAVRGGPQTLALGAVIVAVGWLLRMVMTGSLFQVIAGTTIVGIGTGIGYAAMPSLINAHTPSHEIAAANGLNTLVRSVGSSLASAVGGSILAASTVAIGSIAVPSLTAYRQLFLACAIMSGLAAVVALFIPHQKVRKEERAKISVPG
ncbi:MFS transporter [Rhodococcus sp. X156]|uniref:MFS transporter n=1 Tax=Rhodococcus sp. X156 TaxID=2499145 RepID=UPI0019D0E4C6|nr:MFS transporter [Rhodococcus sp. X156]